MQQNLPIFSVLAEIDQQLATNNRLVLQAEPGAGKSTQVPLSLLKSDWLGKQKIIMLEPRRLAASSIARFLAEQLNEQVGQTIGYHIRNDRKVSQQTQLEIVTEGILTRRLLQDPELADTALIIFDEFHERSIQADLALTLCLDIQENLRDDLKLLVMSATLDGQLLSDFLDQAPFIFCEGRHFPVETLFAAKNLTTNTLDWLKTLTQLTFKAFQNTNGNILVFLPGQREIFKAIESFSENYRVDAELLPLFGALNPKEQQKITRSGSGSQEKRRIIFATNIAETSLTLDNISAVVDSGLEKQLTYDPNSGMTRLQTSKISQASAEQRKGRAGRTQAGQCYRLWTETQHNALLPFTEEEMVQADLSQLVLDLAAWGVGDYQELNWLTPPPQAHFASAQTLLKQLEFIQPKGQITALGQQAQQLGIEPRLSKMLLNAQNHSAQHLSLACDLAALLSERDFLRNDSVDIRQRIDWLIEDRNHKKLPSFINRKTVKQIRQLSDNLHKRLKSPFSDYQNLSDLSQQIGILVAWAFPDRIAQKRSGQQNSQRFLLANGKGATLSEWDNLNQESYLAVCQLDGKNADGRIFLAAPLHKNNLEELFSSLILTEEVYQYQTDKNKIAGKQITKLGALVLEEKKLNDIPNEKFTECLHSLLKKDLSLLNWSAKTQNWLTRVRWLAQFNDDFRGFSEHELIQSLEEWLFPYLGSIKNIQALKSLDLHSLLMSRLDYALQQTLEKEAPSFFESSIGKQFAIHYSSKRPPYVSLPLQAVFGQQSSPMLGFNQQALTFELLSPAQRPIQITNDLAGFWQNSYQEVAKEMRGRYPKHRWPENPLQEEAGHSIKRR